MTNPCRISASPFKVVKELQSTRVENKLKQYVIEMPLISIIAQG